MVKPRHVQCVSQVHPLGVPAKRHTHRGVVVDGHPRETDDPQESSSYLLTMEPVDMAQNPLRLQEDRHRHVDGAIPRLCGRDAGLCNVVTRQDSEPHVGVDGPQGGSATPLAVASVGPGHLDGLANLAPRSPSLAGLSDPSAICTLLATFGVACFACPEGRPSFSVQIEVDSIRGAGEPDGVVPRGTADIATDATCNG